MKVALNLFSEKGYDSTTTKDIANKAEVNEVTIFRHFGSKANLFQLTTEHHVIDAKVDHILDGIKTLDFEQSMKIIAERICILYDENRKLYKVQMKLADSEQAFVKLKLSRKIITVLEAYFQELKKEGKLEGDIHIMATTFVTSLLGALTVDILGEGTVTHIHWKDFAPHYAMQFVALYCTRGER